MLSGCATRRCSCATKRVIHFTGRGSCSTSQKAEVRLRESEELYRNVVEQAAENIFLMDPYNKHILQANASFHHSLGYEGMRSNGPGGRVGLSGMRERAALLGGSFRVASRPGVGTLIVAEIPLWEPVGGPAGDGPDER